jgi:hypothetical protein
MMAVRTLPLAGLLVGLLACHHRPAVEPTGGRRYTEVGLHIINHYWGDVRIYVQHDGVEERVGLVSAASNGAFVLPGRFFTSGSTIRLRAAPVGNPEGFISEALIVQPDQMIIWTLETQLDRSSIMIQ